MNRRVDRLLGVPLVAGLSIFASRPRRNGDIQPERILVLKLAAAGDTILLIPALRALRRKFPEAHLHWVVSPINETIARSVPYVDAFTTWDGRIASLGRLIGQLRARRFDVAIDFEQWARGTALLAFFSGAPVRMGFDTPGQGKSALFTHTYTKSTSQHELLEFYALASLLGELPVDTSLELWESESGREELSRAAPGRDWGPTTGPRVLLHPGCGADGVRREWPIDRYAVLGSWLLARGVQLFLSGGPDEVEKTTRLARALGDAVENLGGKLSWAGTIALVRRMDVVVSGNTGIMHVAAALGKRQLALHGPTNLDLWGPRNPRARVLQAELPSGPSLILGFEYRPEDFSCMQTIRLEQVIEAIRDLLEEE